MNLTAIVFVCLSMYLCPLFLPSVFLLFLFYIFCIMDTSNIPNHKKVIRGDADSCYEYWRKHSEQI